MLLLTYTKPLKIGAHAPMVRARLGDGLRYT